MNQAFMITRFHPISVEHTLHKLNSIEMLFSAFVPSMRCDGPKKTQLVAFQLGSDNCLFIVHNETCRWETLASVDKWTHIRFTIRT